MNEDLPALAALEAALGHRFRESHWLERALTHSSHRHESGETNSPGDYERLEFLGDAVLALITSEYLLHRFPDWTEGELSKARSQLVSAHSLFESARRLGLGAHLRLGRGEEKTGGREKPALLADAYEAVVAAIHLDAGLDAAAAFVRRSLLDFAVDELAESLRSPDHKSALQEWLQARGRPPVSYRVVAESGPDHSKTFVVEVIHDGRTLAAGEGPTKKQAEQLAARRALSSLTSS